MARYLVVYRGGTAPEGGDSDAIMAEWMGWFGSLGSAVAELGAPTGPSTAVGPAGRTDASAEIGGWSIFEAESLDHAARLVEGCPQIKVGGTVEVYEVMAM